MLVIMGSSVVGWLVTYAQIPQAFAAWCMDTLQDPWLIILAMNVIMLIVGMFIDLPAAILLLGPLSVHLAGSIRLATLQLGNIQVLKLRMGLFPPPGGTPQSISHTQTRG